MVFTYACVFGQYIKNIHWNRPWLYTKRTIRLYVQPFESRHVGFSQLFFAENSCLWRPKTDSRYQEWWDWTGTMKSQTRKPQTLFSPIELCEAAELRVYSQRIHAVLGKCFEWPLWKQVVNKRKKKKAFSIQHSFILMIILQSECDAFLCLQTILWAWTRLLLKPGLALTNEPVSCSFLPGRWPSTTWSHSWL